MFTRVIACFSVLVVGGLALPAYTAHDAGEQVDLIGASVDGRFALIRIRDVQKRYVDVILSDVDGKAGDRRRWEGKGKNESAASYLSAIRRKHRIRGVPQARLKRPSSDLEGRLYTWFVKGMGWYRSFALVGELGQRLEPSIAIRCLEPISPDCTPNESERSSLPTKVHWFRTGVYLYVDNWTIQGPVGDESRALVVHRRIPAKPRRPAMPPELQIRAK